MYIYTYIYVYIYICIYIIPFYIYMQYFLLKSRSSLSCTSPASEASCTRPLTFEDVYLMCTYRVPNFI